MNNVTDLLNNINALNKRKEMIKELQAAIIKQTGVLETGSLVILAPKQLKPCVGGLFNHPYCIIVDKQDKPVSECVEIFDTFDMLMDKTNAWKILSWYTLLDETLVNISAYFANKGFSNVMHNFKPTDLKCNNEPLQYFKDNFIGWNLIAYKYEKKLDGTFAYTLTKTLDLYHLKAIPPLAPLNIPSGTQIRTIKWFMENKNKLWLTPNLNFDNKQFKTTSESKLKKKYINVDIKSILHTSANLVMGSFVESGVEYIVAIPQNDTTRVNIYFECTIADDLKKINYPIFDIYDFGVDYEFVIKRKPNENNFGHKIGNLNQQQQIDSLKDIFYLSNRYVIVSGVPLDLRPENLWWDGNKWLLFNIVPRLELNQYDYTLSPENFNEYYTKYWVGKVAVGSIISKYYIKSSALFGNAHIINNNFDEQMLIFAENEIDFNNTYKKLHVKMQDDILKNKDPNYIKCVTKGIKIDDEMLGYLELQKGPPNHNHIDDALTGITDEFAESKDKFNIFKSQMKAIKQLVVDSENFMKSISQNECKSIVKYTGSSYGEMNGCLRSSGRELENTGCFGDSGIGVAEKFEKCKQFMHPTQVDPGKTGLDTVTDLIKSGNAFYDHPSIPKLIDDIILYRSVSDTLPFYPATTMFDDMHIGTIMEDRTFMSTSLKVAQMDQGPSSTVIWKIIMPKGTPAVDIHTISQVESEAEILLRPGSALQFIEKGTITIKSGKYKLYTFRCAFCSDDSVYKMSIPPRLLFQNKDNRLESQQHDKKIGKERIGLDYLKIYYNNLIQPYEQPYDLTQIKTTEPKDRLRIMTWNVSSWRDGNGINQIFWIKEIIDQMNPHILCLQEVLSSDPAFTKLKVVESCKEDTLYNVIAIKLSLPDLSEKQSIPLNHNKCAAYILTEVKNQLLAVITFQLSAISEAERIENIRLLLDFINTQIIHKTKNIIILGDFNSYRAHDLDPIENKSFDSTQNKDLQNELVGWPNAFAATKMLEDDGYVDVCVKYKQEMPSNTSVSGGRMDFIYIHKDWQFGNKAKAYTKYGNEAKHIPIIIDFIY